MEITFFKYQGTGNDFVMIDDRQSVFPAENLSLIQNLCNRRFGIGADGLILIKEKDGYDFEMVYFNADGTQSMCGNGARCAVAFSRFLAIIDRETNFMAIDGPHQANLVEDLVALSMSPVDKIDQIGDDYYVNTGSPHHIRFVEDLWNYPVLEEGSKIRNSTQYAPLGTNVNFVTPLERGIIQVRTFERGVENETLSCGTGVTGCALVYGNQNHLQKVVIHTKGGELAVQFTEVSKGIFENITLTGPAVQVFKGKLEI